MKYNPKLFTSYGFIIGLCLLLGNDLILKPLWGNWLTGKLSDFAGLFVFTLFWIAFLPRFKKIITVCTGLLFICWKSPYSQSCIDFWNTLPLFAIHRVVDYTDLLALIILPLAFYYERNIEKIRSFKLSPVSPF
ncbi:MAG: hypothetical protein LC101_11040 [Flavobacteriales bacterium]|nr:hypothetical protein [Flavobacteriales bacterium]